MKKAKENKQVIVDKTEELCKLYNNLQRFVESIDQLPDAARVQKVKPKPLPQDMVPMLF